ncbi:guanine nucleotide exchange protein smcr8a [Oncorhynchus kisutch]|uniref:Smith-Magenis syndrome chromosome region, candidate 8b n=1 Tax=Oncorhynchus kisutch TaxID=8019 RepID=A0A8C7I8L4_ONCKI|nr:guanine nucleotide exchange protein smcr8a-like [Oncorhynchus kisutch]
MIGSPDVLAFTSEGDLGGYPDVQVLPEEFSLPLLPLSHPWTSPAHFNRDFILVAEFSEQVGPLPVRTIPDDPRVIGSFDLNHFSLRIMSVDYQAAAPGPQPHHQTASPSLQTLPRLAFSEDSRVVLGDSKEGAFAYVHHLTLYDLEARGFVRPFCMAYVSADERKIMLQFQELSLRFSRASECLKTGNRRAFACELQRKLHDLEYTRSILQAALQRISNESAEIREEAELQKTANELASVDRSILDHRSLLHQVTSYPNRKLKDPGFLPYDPSLIPETLPLTPDPPSPSYTPQLVSGASLGGGGWSARRFDRRLKPLEELSDCYFLSLTLEQLGNAERRLRGDQSVLHNRRITHRLSRTLSHTQFLFQLWDQEEEEDLEEEGAGLEGGSGVMSHPVVGAGPQSLESFFSCVEEVSIKLETGSGGAEPTLDPEGEGVTAETRPGSVSSGDSIEVLGTERSYRTQGLTHMELRELSGGLGQGEGCDVVRSCAPAEVWMRRDVRSLARRANSEDSIEIISTSDSIFPDDLIFNAITEEEPEEHGIMGSVIQEEEEEEAAGEDTPIQQHSTLGIVVHEEEEQTRHQRILGNIVQTEGKEELEDTPTRLHRTLGIEVRELEEEKPERWDTPAPLSEPQRTLVHQVSVEGSSQQYEGHHANGEVRGQAGRDSRRVVVPDLQVNFSIPLRLDVRGRGSGGRRLLGDTAYRLSVDEASDCMSNISTSPSSSLPPTHLHGNHSASNPRRHQRQRRKAGPGALRFLRQNSFSQNAVFCLLSGRPLVVIGGEEASVRRTVAALSLYLPSPGRYGDAVQPYLATPLQLTDLLTWRLIGIHRTSPTAPSMLHSLARYGRYLAVLDLDQRTLRSPAYHGHLIGRLANPHTLIGRGSTYLLHVESCLAELTAKAFLFSCSPDLSTLTSGRAQSSPGGQAPPICHSHSDLQLPSLPREDDDFTLTQRRRDFLCGRGFSGEDDLRVMHFLSDLIKQHHAGSGPPALRFSYSAVPLHRNITT